MDQRRVRKGNRRTKETEESKRENGPERARAKSDSLRRWKMVILGRENGSWKVSPSQDGFRLIAQLKGDYGRKMGEAHKDGQRRTQMDRDGQEEDG